MTAGTFQKRKGAAGKISAYLPDDGNLRLFAIVPGAIRRLNYRY